jgi:hypothetical protein
MRDSPCFPRSVSRPVLAAAAAALAQPALAQEPAPEAATLPPMLVVAPRVPSTPTHPSNADAEAAARQIPGNVSIVPDDAFRDRPGVTTIRDVLLYTPGVFAEPKWGEDTRLSIRGSGTSRNFHLRGVRLYQDRMPINQADGSGDFQELDPTDLSARRSLPRRQRLHARARIRWGEASTSSHRPAAAIPACCCGAKAVRSAWPVARRPMAFQVPAGTPGVPSPA